MVTMAGMITKLQMLRNVGQFDSVVAGENVPLARLSVVYAENGRGKTTLAAILRSLASGDPLPIAERRRLASEHPPHIVLECSGGPPPAVFENNAWSRTLPTMVIFDDVFVDENVYSGLVVGAGHRQNLHELILGAQGVTLTRQLRELTTRIETHNSALRAKTAAIPEGIRGGLTVDQFCALPPRDDIDEAIQTAERRLAAAQEQDQVRSAHTFDTFSLPSIDLASIEAVLTRGLPALDADAAAQVEAHFSGWGAGAETWVADGMTRLAEAERDHSAEGCPFCAQDLAGAPLIAHYRTYFSDAYTDHTQGIQAARAAFERAHGGAIVAAFERSVRVAGERRHLWSRYCDVPDLELDTAHVARSWHAARDAVLAALNVKQAAPLEPITLSGEALSAVAAYEAERQAVATLSSELQEANPRIQIVKEQTATANTGTLVPDLARLRAVRERHVPEVSPRCDEYLAETAAKAATEVERAQARTDLAAHRANAFPGYETAINLYLERFNAGFRLGSVSAADTRGGPTCTYSVVINNTPVAVSGAEPTPGEPSFRNTLSSGDRNTLALAFFFASLDQDPNLGDKMVVIDDPITSLDEHRSLTTVQELRRLAERAEQIIVLSHTKMFLCRIWESSDPAARAALQVGRDGTGSTILSWDVNADSETEHDRRHTLLRNYVANAAGADQREVARAIRPLLESFLRVAYPQQFPASTLLGPFRNLCDQRVGTTQEVLSRPDTNELANLVEYANRFHHDTNPAWETEVINDGELRGFVDRTLAFAKR
jgi:wobble nucleotide-excising tRNase